MRRFPYLITIDEYEFDISLDNSTIYIYIFKNTNSYPEPYCIGFLHFNNNTNTGFELSYITEIDLIKIQLEICINLLIENKFIFVKNNKKYLTDHFLLQLL